MYLQSLSEETRQRIHYTFVEASPVNYALLQEKIQRHASLYNLKALAAGVIPDTQSSADNLTFCAISSDIDVNTGLDSRSGKKLPVWASQLSSFSKRNILKHWRPWKKQGLRLEDNIVEMQVATVRFSDLLAQQQGDVVFALIDTEGLDCDIIQGLHSSSALPPFLLYEHKHCGRQGNELAREHLEGLGYTVNHFNGENALATQSDQ